MKYDHNQICTKDNEIVVGNIYQYKEDSWIFKVEIVEEKHKEEWIGFKLKILDFITHPGGRKRGDTFECGAATGKYAYSGMWRLYDDGEYVNSPVVNKQLEADA